LKNSNAILIKNDMEKIHMAEFSNDFGYCWNAAGMHLQAQAQGSLNWLKASLTPPFLEHFSFRLGNQLLFVRVEDIDKEVQSPGTLEGLLSVADGCSGHACLMYMKRKGDEWSCVVPNWGLVDARTETIVDPVALVTDEKIVMTDWELQDFAVQVVRDSLKSEGKEIMSWQSNPNIDPSIWFVGDTGPEWIVVRAARLPEREAVEPRNVEKIAEQCASIGKVGHFASVSAANTNDPFDPNAKESGNYIPLFRGEGIEVSYKGLKVIHTSTVFTPPTDFSGVLIQEFANWFGVFLEKGSVMPKIFTGVNRDGSQFIIDFSRLELDRSKHLDFMRYVLHHEHSIAYAYKMRTNVEVCKEPQILQEQHLFFAGYENSFHSLSITSNAADGWQDGFKVFDESHATAPESFFQELLPNYYNRTSDVVMFGELWQGMRDKVSWRTRS
jgi:hypothetical protein